MKKIIAFLLVLVAALSANAQIKREIFGCTLGVTTPEQAKAIMENQDLVKVLSYDDGLFKAKDDDILLFGGVIWQTVELNFYDGKLMGITFYKGCLKDDSEYKKLKKKLDYKYGSYTYDVLKEIFPSNFVIPEGVLLCGYEDAVKTRVFLGYDDEDGLNLVYADGYLRDLALEESAIEEL